MRNRAGVAARMTLMQTETLHSSETMTHMLSLFDGQGS